MSGMKKVANINCLHGDPIRALVVKPSPIVFFPEGRKNGSKRCEYQLVTQDSWRVRRTHMTQIMSLDIFCSLPLSAVDSVDSQSFLLPLRG